MTNKNSRYKIDRKNHVRLNKTEVFDLIISSSSCLHFTLCEVGTTCFFFHPLSAVISVLAPVCTSIDQFDRRTSENFFLNSSPVELIFNQLVRQVNSLHMLFSVFTQSINHVLAFMFLSSTFIPDILLATRLSSFRMANSKQASSKPSYIQCGPVRYFH